MWASTAAELHARQRKRRGIWPQHWAAGSTWSRAFDSDRTEVFGSGSDRWIVSDAGEAEKVARDVAAALAGGDLTISFSAARGKPAEALVREADRLDAR